jgi:hypothetical protein
VNSALRMQTAKAQPAKEEREEKIQVSYCASTLKLISSTPNPAQLLAACWYAGGLVPDPPSRGSVIWVV